MATQRVETFDRPPHDAALAAPQGGRVRATDPPQRETVGNVTKKVVPSPGCEATEIDQP